MSLEELAFFPMFLPEPILPPLDFPRLLAPNDVNVNDQIMKRYEVRSKLWAVFVSQDAISPRVL